MSFTVLHWCTRSNQLGFSNWKDKRSWSGEGLKRKKASFWFREVSLVRASVSWLSHSSLTQHKFGVFGDFSFITFPFYMIVFQTDEERVQWWKRVKKWTPILVPSFQKLSKVRNFWTKNSYKKLRQNTWIPSYTLFPFKKGVKNPSHRIHPSSPPTHW